MKETIRTGVWETNSSSIHALCVQKEVLSVESVLKKASPDLIRWIKLEGLIIGRKCEFPDFKYPSEEIEMFEDLLTLTFLYCSPEMSSIDYNVLVFFSDLAEKLGVGLSFCSDLENGIIGTKYEGDCYSMACIISNNCDSSGEVESILVSFLRFLILPEEVKTYVISRSPEKEGDTDFTTIPEDFIDVSFTVKD